MSPVAQPERETQGRVLKLFTSELGYRYLDNWTDREHNSNVEEALLSAYLQRAGYSASHISKAVHDLQAEADNPVRALFDSNLAVYKLLRYGVNVKVAAGTNSDTVWLIDWAHPQANDFAIAQEVTLRGGHERRPDLVLYINGIAIAVIELKNSRHTISDGIRQLISNQSKEFNHAFFATVQFVFAGNDTEGLRYGTTGTEEKYFLRWKEDEADNSRLKLDKYLLKMCDKARIIELVHDFVLFDAGQKKLPRFHQYFGIKAAQARVHAHEGGIIWHTQGSGKSLTMVWLAKWILENKPNARVVVVTDRDELDKQIKGVFVDSGESGVVRAGSGQDLMARLAEPKSRLICSLIHKFGKKDVDNFEAFIQELASQPSRAVGDIFVFIDECHRTQSGKLHRTMKALMPNAVLIGFTGTPLLKKDKSTSLEIFGGKPYIHTYLFDEAVQDEVVLDLVYEARDIDQRLRSEDKVDAWFEAKTRALNDWQRAALREQWGTLQKVLSSRSRMERVVQDMVLDFSTRPRLSSKRGNALLVASSIHEACKYYDLFQRTEFKGRCAVVTSYNPMARDVTMEDTGANTETEKQFIYNVYTALLKDVVPAPNKSKTETYEDQAKDLFKKQPANMRLLIVVDKLLTGFDAPTCTYLYIDKSMQDHGLFQAICRVNRLDGEDKTYGYIVDFKNLLKKVQGAIEVYTSELDASGVEGQDPAVHMKDRLAKGKEVLDAAVEALALLCEPVAPPKGTLEHIHYFCGNTDIPADLANHETQRVALYRGVATLVRAHAAIADDLLAAGYTAWQVQDLAGLVKHYLGLRDEIRHASGETIDLKAYEADMRYLIDTYIEADDPRKISQFDDVPLLELLVKSGLQAAREALPPSISGNKGAVAETIENNVRRKIIKDHLSDPAYYEKMSALLDEIIAARKAGALEYEQYLAQLAALAAKVQAGRDQTTHVRLDTPGRRALYNNLKSALDARANGDFLGDSLYDDPEEVVKLAMRVDAAVRQDRPDDWRGVLAREQVVKAAMYQVLNDIELVLALFAVIKQQAEY